MHRTFPSGRILRSRHGPQSEIRITGTLGVLLKAKRDGEIPSLKSEMDRLVQEAGFFVSDRVRDTFLAEAGELS